MSETTTGLRYTQQAAIGVITIDRAERRNPLGLPGDGDWFAATTARLQRDSGVRVVVVTGAGTAFSTGGDLKAMRERSGEFAGDPAALIDRYRNGVQRIVRSLWDLELPLIAAVNGPAVGLGNDVACTADMRLAAASARFSAAFVNMGLVPGDGGAWLLHRLLGPARAADLLLTGRSIDAATALQWGLVSEVLPDAELLAAAMDRAERIARQPATAVRLIKRLLRAAQVADLATVMELSAALQAAAHGTADHHEAVAAFFERRPPGAGGR